MTKEPENTPLQSDRNLFDQMILYLRLPIPLKTSLSVSKTTSLKNHRQCREFQIKPIF
ncbi:hypothetical protein LEP1GSC066_3370 [Leptospira sp. serovar Kenya str. Sh9]|nr:hypothetical protein LEP1GSC066_3370 [Leptospira sp. serovar Kenya str. Sh9]